MAIETRIAPHFGWKYFIMAVVCLVLGVWGIYDYVEVIPSRLQAHERGDVSRAVRDGIVPGASRDLRNTAREMLQEERERFADRYPEAAQAATVMPDDVDAAKALAGRTADIINSLRRDEQQPWTTSLALFAAALDRPSVPEGQTLSGVQLHAYEVADRVAQHVATIKRPSFYDRPTQWAFILCLPFTPWALWVLLVTRRRVYRLDDGGKLHISHAAANGAPREWGQEDIKDIDMSQWMRKSIAWVEHKDGHRIKLDDYKHKNLHLIIGAIASRLYPDQWDAQAKPVKGKRGTQAAEAETNEAPPATDGEAGSTDTQTSTAEKS